MVVLVASACAASAATDPAPSVVRVTGVACGQATVGGGVVVEPGVIVTNAHVLAGADTVEVAFAGQPTALAAEPIAFDPNRDLALLAVDSDASAVGLGEDASGMEGRLLTVDEAGELVERPFVIRRAITATGEDIYRELGARRRALEVDLDVTSGESGSGLFDTDGRLVGIVFAMSRTTDGIAYAVAATELEAFLAEPHDGPVDPGPCR